MKIGRNDFCPCGSGKKFKKCCLDAANPVLPTAAERKKNADFRAQAEAMFRQQRASENIRKQQQGYGNPITSWFDEGRGLRFVAVKTTVHWSKDWLIFPNFLDYFMKKQLGLEWGERERSNGQHPLFRWLQKTQEHSGNKSGEPKVKTIVMMGFIACWLHLAYALYLIAHHDELPKRLIRRLRDPVCFMPAYHEAIVGAALAVAGMALSCAETKSGSKPTPEFRAKSKTSGKTYEVEAKRKNSWNTPTGDVTNADFQGELEIYIRDQIYNASRKRLNNPIFWFELSIPTLVSEADWQTVVKVASAVIRDAEETIKVDGQQIAAAYVIVTNHTFLANEDVTGMPRFGYLQTLRIEDFPLGQPMEIEAALEGYDKHRDIFGLMEAWKTACEVPTTFDGSPPELLDSDGKPQRTIKIGDIIEVPGMDGNTVRARIEDICSSGNDNAVVCVGANGYQWLVKMPLTEGEVRATERFTDAVFGKDNSSRRLRDDDPFDLYDWFLEAYSKMNQEQISKFFEQNPNLAQYQHLPLNDARKRIAREYTKSMWAHHQHHQTAEFQGANVEGATSPPAPSKAKDSRPKRPNPG
jgi:hypothetical protein